jgi:hypothetical protein
MMTFKAVEVNQILLRIAGNYAQISVVLGIGAFGQQLSDLISLLLAYPSFVKG